MAKRTYYEILKVERDAPSNEIRKAFRIRAAECHPDKVGHLPAEKQERARKKMALVNEAYTVLRDDEKRREYDEFLGLLEEKARQKAEPSESSVSKALGSRPPASQASASSHLSQATEARAPAPATAVAPPPPTPAASKPPPPPPELNGEELLQALMRALDWVEKGLIQSYPKARFQKVSVSDFDLVLTGEIEDSRILLMVSTHDKLDGARARSLREIARLSEIANQYQLKKVYISLLHCCLKMSDEKALKTEIRDSNQGALGTFLKRRGNTQMSGILHIPSGEFFFPYGRTILPNFSYLQDIACRY